MNQPPSDDDLRQRLRELGTEESAHAPSFRSIRDRRALEPARADWVRPAFALAALLLACAGWWLLQVREPAVELHTAEVERLEAEVDDVLATADWATATDGLLADANGPAAANAERLAAEITALLQP